MINCWFRSTQKASESGATAASARSQKHGYVLTAIVSVAVLAPDVTWGTPYTLNAPIAITGGEVGNPGVVGTLHPVALDASLGDPFGITDGNVSFVTNDVLVVRLSLAAGSTSVDGLGVGANSTPFFGNPVGAGAYAETGQAPSAVTANPLLLAGLFDFIPDPVSAGESSVRLFVTYNPEGSALAVGSTTNFMISSGTDFTVQGTLIPEPRSALLLATGLGMLAFRHRHAPRRERRSTDAR